MSNSDNDPITSRAAYGGDAWEPRLNTHQQELGTLWRECGIDSEWSRLRCVLLHKPGNELEVSEADSDSKLLLGTVDLAKAREEHDQLAETYRTEGVDIIHALPVDSPFPNQMFCADTFVMTPEGAILARPASRVRAGEEALVARGLADAGVPILRTLTGDAVFEGADLMWLDPRTAMIGRGHRTNQAAIEQIERTLNEINCELIAVDLPFGTMHFMGMLRIAAKDLAICWRQRTPHTTVNALRERGFKVEFLPDDDQLSLYRAMNFVTLESGRVLMVAGLDGARHWLESLGIECLTSPTDELYKAAGNIGCLTGVVARDMTA